MSKSHDGFYSIYENGTWGDGNPYSPQALPIENESLGIHQEIRFQDKLVGSGRVHSSRSLVPLSKSPAGAIGYSFRSDNCGKVFFSHFQYGSNRGTAGSGYHYTFYPSKGNPNFRGVGTYGDGPYGGTGQVYTVSILKRVSDTGTNAFFYKNGVCNTLKIKLTQNEEAKLEADYLFRSVDVGTAIQGTILGGGYGGQYSQEPSLHAIYGTILWDGGSLEVEEVGLTLKNNIEVNTRVGTNVPQNFRFGRYSVEGDISFDMPTDGIKYIGKMLGTQSFSLFFGLAAPGGGRVDFSLPNCVLSPFDINLGDNDYRLKLPFRGFELGNLPPVQVDVYTTGGITFTAGNYWDALLGGRTLSEFTFHDAEEGNRSSSTYGTYNRDQ